MRDGKNIPRHDDERATKGRWHEWVGVTIALHVGTFILYPIFICGCHFHATAAFIGTIPIVWTAITIIASHSRGERILAAINVLLTFAWLYMEWESNLRFLFWPFGSRSV